MCVGQEGTCFRVEEKNAFFFFSATFVLVADPLVSFSFGLPILRWHVFSFPLSLNVEPLRPCFLSNPRNRILLLHRERDEHKRIDSKPCARLGDNRLHSISCVLRPTTKGNLMSIFQISKLNSLLIDTHIRMFPIFFFSSLLYRWVINDRKSFSSNNIKRTRGYNKIIRLSRYFPFCPTRRHNVAIN